MKLTVLTIILFAVSVYHYCMHCTSLVSKNRVIPWQQVT